MGLVLAFNKANAQPEFTVAASISGAPLVNSMLTCNYTVARARDQNVSVEWLGTVLSGQGEGVLGTDITYIPSVADEGRQIRVVVTATNPAGTVQSFSDYTSAIVNEDTPAGGITAGPAISLDDFANAAPALTFAQGEYVKCEVTASSGTPAFQWFYDDDGAGTNKTNLTGEAATQPLQYSQPNNWKSACFISTSVPVGKRVGCDVTLGATTVRAYMAGNLAAIEGTPISQSTVGSAPAAPYKITGAGRYYLTEDIEFAGSGFYFGQNQTTLNLNGYTISYNALTVPSVVNGDFEDGATGWDFTNAPNASIHTPADAALAYRDCELFTGTKSIKFDATQTEYIQSSSPITLTAGVRYAVGGSIAWGPNVSASGSAAGYVRLIASDGTTVVASAYAGPISPSQWNTRGMQHVAAEYTPASTGDFYIRVGCVGNADSSEYDLHIDDVHIGQARVSGVMFKQYGTQDQADINPLASTQIWQIKVRNGTIEEVNRSISTFGYRNGCLYGAGNVRGNAFTRLTLIARGDNCHCLYTADSVNPEYSNTVANCTLTNHTLICVVRDNYYGSISYGWSGTLAYNTITKGAVAGFVEGGLKPWSIYGNSITLQARYSNGFAIRANPGGKVFDNYIPGGSGGDQCRGIALTSGTQASPTEVYNNWIETQESGLVQEYQGGWPDGNYGIQVDAGGSTTYDMDIHDNVVIANYSTLRPSQALRLSYPANESIVRCYARNNDLRAYSSSSQKSACISVYRGTGFSFSGNTLRTNSTLYHASGGVSDYTLDGSHIYADSLIATPHPYRIQYQADGSALTFTNTTFEDAGSQTYFNDSVVYQDNGTYPPTSTLTVNKTS